VALSLGEEYGVCDSKTVHGAVETKTTTHAQTDVQTITRTDRQTDRHPDVQTVLPAVETRKLKSMAAHRVLDASAIASAIM